MLSNDRNALCVVGLLAIVVLITIGTRTDLTVGLRHWFRPIAAMNSKSINQPPRERHPCEDNYNLTVVTAFFDIGKFGKGSHSNVWSAGTYHNWMRVFEFMQNKLIVYVANNNDMVHFQKILNRSHSVNLTKIILLNKTELWSFRLVPKIAEIFNQPGYPKITPNTMVPEYSAAMHAKYEVVNFAIDSNPFRTKYFCWLDIGLFRSIVDTKEKFSLAVPRQHKEDHVSYSIVNARNTKLKPQDVISSDLAWVCGCFFLARSDIMLTWIKEYKAAVETLISNKLMSTDQQVIYIAYNNVTNPPSTKLQVVQPDGRFDPWFHLGYIARVEGEKCKNIVLGGNTTNMSNVSGGSRIQTTPLPAKVN